ncbi:MAG: hypothetical protein JWP97_5615 [Labilithrix sp.]|nr:hypothetical protein [Labilithrix sp.]
MRDFVSASVVRKLLASRVDVLAGYTMKFHGDTIAPTRLLGYFQGGPPSALGLAVHVMRWVVGVGGR